MDEALDDAVWQSLQSDTVQVALPRQCQHLTQRRNVSARLCNALLTAASVQGEPLIFTADGCRFLVRMMDSLPHDMRVAFVAVLRGQHAASIRTWFEEPGKLIVWAAFALHELCFYGECSPAAFGLDVGTFWDNLARVLQDGVSSTRIIAVRCLAFLNGPALAQSMNEERWRLLDAALQASPLCVVAAVCAVVKALVWRNTTMQHEASSKVGKSLGDAPGRFHGAIISSSRTLETVFASEDSNRQSSAPFTVFDVSLFDSPQLQCEALSVMRSVWALFEAIAALSYANDDIVAEAEPLWRPRYADIDRTVRDRRGEFANGKLALNVLKCVAPWLHTLPTHGDSVKVLVSAFCCTSVMVFNNAGCQSSVLEWLVEQAEYVCNLMHTCDGRRASSSTVSYEEPVRHLLCVMQNIAYGSSAQQRALFNAGITLRIRDLATSGGPLSACASSALALCMSENSAQWRTVFSDQADDQNSALVRYVRLANDVQPDDLCGYLCVAESASSACTSGYCDLSSESSDDDEVPSTESCLLFVAEMAWISIGLVADRREPIPRGEVRRSVVDWSLCCALLAELCRNVSLVQIGTPEMWMAGLRTVVQQVFTLNDDVERVFLACSSEDWRPFVAVYKSSGDTVALPRNMSISSSRFRVFELGKPFIAPLVFQHRLSLAEPATVAENCLPAASSSSEATEWIQRSIVEVLRDAGGWNRLRTVDDSVYSDNDSDSLSECGDM